jgi:hypothetical protein
MIQWILEHLGVVVVIVLFLSQIIRGVLQSRKTTSEREVKREDGMEGRRVREVQEQIRRQIEARRAGHVPPATPPTFSREVETGPAPRPETTQMPEPFGGPLGRMLEELQRKAQQAQAPKPPAAPPVLAERRHAAEVERQQRLADELRQAEEARLMAQRRAESVMAEKRAEAESEAALRAAARDRVLGDLSDPQSVRRAFVLREVLGTPVGLR